MRGTCLPPRVPTQRAGGLLLSPPGPYHPERPAIDAKIEIYAWDLGYDEIDELAEALADTLARRGAASNPKNENNPLKSLVVVTDTDVEERPGNTDEEQLEWFNRVTGDARLIIAPAIQN